MRVSEERVLGKRTSDAVLCVDQEKKKQPLPILSPDPVCVHLSSEPAAVSRDEDAAERQARLRN